jgi:hypothetical protein
MVTTLSLAILSDLALVLISPVEYFSGLGYLSIPFLFSFAVSPLFFDKVV